MVGGGAHAMLQAWRSEDSLQELVFSFHHVSSGNQIKGAGISSKCLTLLVISSAALVSFLSHIDNSRSMYRKSWLNRFFCESLFYGVAYNILLSKGTKIH